LKKKTKILIVGGTGFIGYHLSKSCIKKNWNVTSISTRRPKKKRFLNKIKYVICDISQKNELKKKINEKFDYVVNLGGHVDHSNIKKTFRSHFIGLKNLTEIFENNKPKLFIQLGSGGEYGLCKSPHREGKGKVPKSTYYKSKYLATKLLISLYKKKNFPISILRLYQAYGPRQDLNRLIPIAIYNCLKNKRFDCSSGIQFRDFVYVDDVIRSIMNTLKNKQNAKGEIINIGSGKTVQVKNVITKIRKKIGKGFPLFGKIKLREDEMIKVYPSIKKAKKLIKWSPKISLEKGLKKTISFYEST